MRNGLAMEWIRVSRLRSTWLLAALAVLVGAVTSMVSAWVAASMPDIIGPVTPEEGLALVVGRSSAAPALAAVLGVLAVAVERRHGTLTLTVLTEPRWRPRVLLAKLAVVSVIVVGVAMVSAALGALVGQLVLPNPPGPGPAWWAAGAGVVLATVASAALGVAVGVVVRSAAAAVVVVLVVPTLVDRVTNLTALSAGSGPPWVADLLPTRALSALQTVTAPSDAIVLADAAGRPAVWVSVLALVIGCTLALVVASAVFTRQDPAGR